MRRTGHVTVDASTKEQTGSTTVFDFRRCPGASPSGPTQLGLDARPGAHDRPITEDGEDLGLRHPQNSDDHIHVQLRADRRILTEAESGLVDLYFTFLCYR